jgi:CHAT domain-containing protein
MPILVTTARPRPHTGAVSSPTLPRSRAKVWSSAAWDLVRFHLFQTASLAVLLLLIPLKDSQPINPESEFDRVRSSFLAGQVEESQLRADHDYRALLGRDPEWASKFQLLEAEILVRRGHYDGALHLLQDFRAPANSPEETVQQLVVESTAFTRQKELSLADKSLTRAQQLCTGRAYLACGNVLRARGILAVSQGKMLEAEQSFLETLTFARVHHDRFLEATAALNLGWAALHAEHYDEAVDWSRTAYQASVAMGAEDLAESSSGNLGWAYFRLGDDERALGLFLKAENSARKMGNTGEELRRLTDAGYVEQNTGDLNRAIDSYEQAFALAKEIDSKQDIINSLESLAHLSIENGKLDEAGAYLDQLAPLLQTNPDRLDQLDVLLAQGRIAAARGQDTQAETLFRTVADDPASQTSMRLGAEHELAQLDERRGDLAAADRMYATALATFEQARDQLKKEDSKLPFLTNAAPIYDDYINLLVKQGRADEALAVADHSRARTLAQGLGLAISAQPAALSPRRIAQDAGATLLFYWLGTQQSYLWAVTPRKISLFPLPGQNEIARMANDYRNALLGPDDPLASANPAGEALYRTLIAPAASLIRSGSNVIILSDGVLSQLNFETFIVPAPHPHYWIDDATVISAPSLFMLASAKPPEVRGRRLLLLGDAMSPDPDYPVLPNASVEMRRIERHFAAPEETVFAGRNANPQAYAGSALAQYAYIHFVAHGVASPTDPLDSAIILSPSVAGGAFKLYARAIIQHPLHARLVTISSCYGGGTRSYLGEGLVGLSWAFLHAGAHNVIGALWEVSDDSTPALMDSLYQGLEQGLPPSAALRQAQLAMLHGQPDFRSPFFWAPFQLYTGL